MTYFRIMENLIIRDATIADLPELLEFEQELIKAERPFDTTIKNDPVSYYDIEAYIKNVDIKVIVAEHQNKIVSSGYALKKEARHYLDHKYYGYLGFMYTTPSHRGNGINKLIVETLVHWCKSQNLQEIRLTVYDDNLPAVKAYEKVGFKKHISEMRIV
ncbi:GNAT family N-acetyltransferase [uncultured Croceitalea sp.]|uniref:GNAT family N-acetyltransferase n=1 Tax=uncultured Croceitalea sp. TaxID=1798908 RepID=UPI0033064A76